MRPGTCSLTFSLIFLAGVSLGRTSGRVGQKRFSSKRFTPARSRRGEDDLGDTCSNLRPTRHRPLGDQKNLLPPFFPRLPPSLHRSTHSSRGPPRRQSGAWLNRSGSPPALCLRSYLRLRVRALSCAFVPAQEFRPRCFNSSREAAVAFCLSRPFFAFSPPGTLRALHFFLIFFLSPAFIYFQSSQPPNSSPNPFARPSPFTLLPTPASNLPHLSFRRSAPPTSPSLLPKAGKR